MFIVLEGIDGAGCGAQRKALEKLGKLNDKPIFTLKYPHYKDSVGKAVHSFLHQKFDLSVEAQFLLYTFQMVTERKKIADLRKKGILACDRYFTSTLCYQTVLGFPLQKALVFAKIFQIEIPDLVIFLDVTPKTALKRKEKEDGKINLDRYEKDLKMMQKVDNMYQKLAEFHIFAPWVRVDGRRPIKAVTEEILQVILTRK